MIQVGVLPPLELLSQEEPAPAGNAVTDFLSGLPVGVLGPAALASLAVLYILTGKLVPRSQYESLEKIKDAEIARLVDDVNRWVGVAERAENLADRQAAQISLLLEGGRVTIRAVESLQEAATETRGSADVQ